MSKFKELSRDEIFQEIRQQLSALFDLPENGITMQSKLYEDLDLDSIDAVDLIVRLQDLTKKRIQQEQFKSVRTVEDVVDSVVRMLAD